jgi:hypothetical protein
VVCLLAPEEFWAIGQFYQDFSQVEDEEVIQLLRGFSPAARSKQAAPRATHVPARVGKGSEAAR